MATIASSALTFLDTTDHNQLSAYLSSNFPTIQTCTSNGQVFSPSWSKETPLRIQLHAFFNQTEIDYKDTSYTITWYMQDGTNDRKERTEHKGKSAIEISYNALSPKYLDSGMLTVWCRVKLDDINYVESQITYTLIGEAKTVVFSVYTPDGNIFLNQSGTLTLATNKYYGSNEITSGATFQWYKYENTDWVAVSGATSDTLTVSGSDVINIASYKCVMTYDSVEYIGVITLQDKSDPYVSEIYTIGGNIFKNGIGGSAVYIIVRSNGQEVDELAGPISATAPSAPVTGDYWYYMDATNDQIVKKRYNGSSWANYDIPQTLEYIWSLMDKDGNEVTFSDGSETKTGKVIYMSCSDITDTGTLQCDVMQKE
jgi:hypothetical protein